MGRLVSGWDNFRTTDGLLSSLAVLQFFYFMTLTSINWLCLFSYGIKLNLAQAFFYTGGQIHSLIINLTPAGLGIVEAFSLYIGQILDLSPAEVLMAQGLSRLMAISLLAFLGLWGWIYITGLTKKYKKNLVNP
jgi:uncharacterized membrane protein YbhN (UPF0104 family)